MAEISLIFFTSLAQAAVGMIVLLAILPQKSAEPVRPVDGICNYLDMHGGCALITAIALFCLGVLFSFLHISSPFVSFYTITNVATSWLSREILFVILFGVACLTLFFMRTRMLHMLAAIIGFGLVYVMSQVYSNLPVAFWRSSLTLWVFLSTALLLGSATLLLVKTICHCRQNTSENIDFGILPLILMIAGALRLVFGILQLICADWESATLRTDLLFLHLCGVVLGMILLFLAIQKNNKALPFATLISMAVALFWAAEICGRGMFCGALTQFAM